MKTNVTSNLQVSIVILINVYSTATWLIKHAIYQVLLLVGLGDIVLAFAFYNSKDCCILSVHTFAAV